MGRTPSSRDLRPPKLKRICPKCGAQPGHKCVSTRRVSADGGYAKPMKDFHKER